MSKDPCGGRTQVTLVTFVTGASAALREEQIARSLLFSAPNAASAVLLEGLASGGDALADHSAQHQIVRIASGCLCCTGNLAMRVHLNRLLRARPAQLFIGLADHTHIDRLHKMLSEAPYDEWLTLSALSAPQHHS